MAADGALRAAERSYPTFEVRGRSWEDPRPGGQRPRRVTPRPRSGSAAESAKLQRRRNGREELPKCEVRGGGQEELPRVQGQGRQPGGASPHPRTRVAAGRTNPTSNEWWLRRHRRA